MLSIPLFKLLVLFAWVASCWGSRCWWQDVSISKPSEDAHYMWKDADQSQQLLCPMSSGHDVVLCQQPDWSGECYGSHIPRDQNCTNVDPEVDGMASSVHTLGGCVRLYDEADCQGKWRVFDEGTDGHNSLLEMNNVVSSVGLCSEEDRPKGGCNQATPQGRLRCSLMVNKTTTVEVTSPSSNYESEQSYIIIRTGLIFLGLGVVGGCIIGVIRYFLCCCLFKGDGPKYRPVNTGPLIAKNSCSFLAEKVMPGVFIVDETGKVYKKGLDSTLFEKHVS